LWPFFLSVFVLILNSAPMPLVSRQDLIAAVARGAVVSFPTDTVSAFAARPDAADRIFELKQRQPDKPLILMGGDPEQLWPYVVGNDRDLAAWQTIATRYWPGALTLVLPSSERVPATMNPLDSGTIGIRIPNCDLTRDLLRATGVLATTSANRSGEAPLADPQAIAAAFPEAYVLDEVDQMPPTQPASGTPSTVVRWQDGEWEVLRQGEITIDP
jgi:L-threonylcarbamoyladenylate synthase